MSKPKKDQIYLDRTPIKSRLKVVGSAIINHVTHKPIYGMTEIKSGKNKGKVRVVILSKAMKYKTIIINRSDIKDMKGCM